MVLSPAGQRFRGGWAIIVAQPTASLRRDTCPQQRTRLHLMQNRQPQHGRYHHLSSSSTAHVVARTLTTAALPMPPPIRGLQLQLGVPVGHQRHTNGISNTDLRDGLSAVLRRLLRTLPPGQKAQPRQLLQCPRLDAPSPLQGIRKGRTTYTAARACTADRRVALPLPACRRHHSLAPRSAGLPPPWPKNTCASDRTSKSAQAEAAVSIRRKPANHDEGMESGGRPLKNGSMGV